MMPRDKISVIIPIYNVEKYLALCLESVVSQTYQNLEIILVDDGSEDYSLDICADFQRRDARIMVIHQENAGVSSARNAGLKKASGEYICFIDPDDWVECNMVEILYKAVMSTKNPYSSMVICGCYEEYYCADEWMETKEYHLAENGIKSSRGIKENVMEYLEQWRPELWNKFFPKRIIEDEKFDYNIVLGEDLEFLSRVLKYITDFVMIDECLYHFRIDDSKEKKYQTTLFEEEVKREQMILDELIHWGVPVKGAEKYMKGRLLLISYTSCYYACRYNDLDQAGNMIKNILTNNTLQSCTHILPRGRYRHTQWIMKVLIKCRNLFLCMKFFSYIVHRRGRK